MGEIRFYTQKQSIRIKSHSSCSHHSELISFQVTIKRFTVGLQFLPSSLPHTPPSFHRLRGKENKTFTTLFMKKKSTVKNNTYNFCFKILQETGVPKRTADWGDWTSLVQLQHTDYVDSLFTGDILLSCSKINGTTKTDWYTARGWLEMIYRWSSCNDHSIWCTHVHHSMGWAKWKENICSAYTLSFLRFRWVMEKA